MCYLQLIMRKHIYSVVFYCTVFALLLVSLSCTKEPNTTRSETTKLALRDVGHHLLLSNQDSTSLIMPVIDLGNFKYPTVDISGETWRSSKCVCVWLGLKSPDF